jgi:hypothetical protein
VESDSNVDCSHVESNRPMLQGLGDGLDAAHDREARRAEACVAQPLPDVVHRLSLNSLSLYQREGGREGGIEDVRQI